MEAWEYQNIQSKIQEESNNNLLREMHRMQQEAASTSSGGGLSPRAIIAVLIGLAVCGLMMPLAFLLPLTLGAALDLSANVTGILISLAGGVVIVLSVIIAVCIYNKMQKKDLGN